MNLGKIYHRNLNVTIDKTAEKNQELSKSQAFDEIIKGAADFFTEDKTGKDFVVQCLELRGGTLTPNEDNPYENLICQLGKNKNNYWFTGTEVFPRGFQKTLAIGFIRDKGFHAFENGKFDFTKFKKWIIDDSYSKKFANCLKSEYFEHIGLYKEHQDLIVTFGNTEYTNKISLYTIAAKHLISKKDYIDVLANGFQTNKNIRLRQDDGVAREQLENKLSCNTEDQFSRDYRKNNIVQRKIRTNEEFDIINKSCNELLLYKFTYNARMNITTLLQHCITDVNGMDNFQKYLTDEPLTINFSSSLDRVDLTIADWKYLKDILGFDVKIDKRKSLECLLDILTVNSIDGFDAKSNLCIINRQEKLGSFVTKVFNLKDNLEEIQSDGTNAIDSYIKPLLGDLCRSKSADKSIFKSFRNWINNSNSTKFDLMQDQRYKNIPPLNTELKLQLCKILDLGNNQTINEAKLNCLLAILDGKVVNNRSKSSANKESKIISEHNIGVVTVHNKYANKEFGNEDKISKYVSKLPDNAREELKQHLSFQTLIDKETTNKIVLDGRNKVSRKFSLRPNEGVSNLPNYQIFEEFIDNVMKNRDKALDSIEDGVTVRQKIFLDLLGEFINTLKILTKYKISSNDMHAKNMKIRFSEDYYPGTTINKISKVVVFDWGHAKCGQDYKVTDDLEFHMNTPGSILKIIKDVIVDGIQEGRNIYTKIRREALKEQKDYKTYLHKTPIAYIMYGLQGNHSANMRKETINQYEKLIKSDRIRSVISNIKNAAHSLFESREKIQSDVSTEKNKDFELSFSLLYECIIQNGSDAN